MFLEKNGFPPALAYARKSGIQAKSSQAQVYENIFIPEILEHSVNLKLRHDYNERKAEFAEVLRANKMKARMRA